MEGQAEDHPFFEAMQSHRVRGWIRLMRRLPAEPRCAVCRAPYGGVGGRIVKPFGFGPSRKNPRLCARCFEDVPAGGVDTEVGVLFADVRGFTTLTEGRDRADVVALLNRFYEAASDVLCRHAIIDKLVGDEVMALYLPQLFDADVTDHMVADARELLDRLDGHPDVGIGLDFGPAQVGNVGAGTVKDFTAIGDVVNTASRLQGVAAGGQIVASTRVVPGPPADGARASFQLKGKSEPVEAIVITPTRSSRAAST